jgi:phosphoserine aminotransferase
MTDKAMNRIYNFSAGPATLPVSVLEEATEAVREYDGSGMSLLELSHRGKHYDPIHAEALAGVLDVLGLSPDEFSVALLGGGASLQFAMVPMNFLEAGQTADYAIGGEWGAKAAEDARRFGTVHITGQATDRLPDLNLSGSARYVHVTTNNTIEGTQMHGPLPDTGGAPLIADASSDIFGVARDHAKLDLLYFGAQKNAGAAGVTAVVVRKSFLETAKKDLPPMLSYRTQVAKDSLYNTPPVFPIFVLTRVLRWIRAEGGVAGIGARNGRKAGLVYAALDAAPELYRPCIAEKAHRSWMNVTWRMADERLEKELLVEAQQNGMDGLKGHRNVGGFRASIYNAFPEEGCQALAALLTDFAQRKG